MTVEAEEVLRMEATLHRQTTVALHLLWTGHSLQLTIVSNTEW